MNLDGIIKFFAPKGMHISDSPRATASEQLTVTDIMAALGMTQAEAGIGLAMFLGKAGISSQDKEAAVAWLTEYAKEKAPLALRRAAGKKFPLCMRIIATFAYNDYASSAADSYDCPKCAGKGLIEKSGVLVKVTTRCASRSGLRICGNRRLISRLSARLKTWSTSCAPGAKAMARSASAASVAVPGRPLTGRPLISRACRCTSSASAVRAGGTADLNHRWRTEACWRSCQRCRNAHGDITGSRSTKAWLRSASRRKATAIRS